MGMLSFIKEVGDELFGIGEAKMAEEVAKKDPMPVSVGAANKPMLSHLDKIYPGQMLRIPPQ